VSDAGRADQIGYYRRRAAEYDSTAYGQVHDAKARIADLVGQLNPTGDVLEIASGTGAWTEALAGFARSVTAIDAAPEMVELARGRLRGRRVELLCADVFNWTPPRRFDTVFFAFWLSHVPSPMFAPFWSLVGSCLAESGRVVFVDEQVGEAVKETCVAGSPELVVRRLRDGSVHRVVKVFRGARDIEHAVARLGWCATVRPAGFDWLIGEAQPA
jgi:demethylmenaquinone methyltransferase/2-methoxy-6-polyprenyl-1,4-benzoquinol methylase